MEKNADSMAEEEWLAYTAEVWGEQYGRKLTLEEAKEIDTNAGRLCDLLIRMAREELRKEKAGKETTGITAGQGGQKSSE